MELKPGMAVLFWYNNKRNYKIIKKIVLTADGMMAQFDPGCACKSFLMPLNELFTDKDEFLTYLKEKGVA